MYVPRFTNEPICDYANAAHVEAAHRAVAQLRNTFGAFHPARIGGREVTTEKAIVSSAPARPELIIGRTASCTKEHVDQAIQAAQEAFKSWSRTTPDARAELLFKLAAMMRQRRFELLAILSFEIGKDWYEADAEIAEAIDFCEYYGRLALTHFQYAPLTRLPNEDNCYHYIPLGVGVVISPWNFPLAILAGMTLAAVVSGNTVVVKPSSDTPVIAAKLFEMAREAGIPEGVLNLTPGSGGEIGDYLVTHPQVRFVAFTGSADVGLRINEYIARPDPRRKWMTRYVSEMGGKNAILVDETADLDAASSGIVRSAFGFQGQKCSACSRVIVDRRVKAKLLDLVIEKTKKLTVADPWEDCCVFIGPVANQGAYRDILKAIETGKGEARLVMGGKPFDREGYYVEPTIFDGAKGEGFLGQTEIFGPVTAFIEVDSFEQALEVANGTDFGLTGALYSQAIERLDRARSEFHVGNLYLNRGCTGALVGVHPFGGFNLSGTDSKAGGPDYLLNFTQGKTTSERVTVIRAPGIGV
jgi:1-pyrroline-5-carboxylate dehydrogenase